MISQKTWEDLNQKIKEVIEKSPAKDLEKNLRAMMEGVFTRLNLVTREEFDVQAELLARTREKLTELEAKLDKMAQPPATEAAQEFVAAKKEEAGM